MTIQEETLKIYLKNQKLYTHRKMYLPKIKIKIPDKDTIRDVVDETGKEFIGSFFETYKGELFSGTRPTSNSKPLQSSDTLESNFPTNQEVTFKIEFTPPTEKQLADGKFKRYFLQDRRTKNIAEITKEKFDNLEPNLYTQKASLDWTLTPPAKDVYFNGVTFDGAETKNRQAVQQASQTVEGLQQYVQDYAQFVPESKISGDKTTPPPESNTGFDIPSPS